MPATTLPTDERIWAAFRTPGRAMEQIPGTAASKAASSPASSRNCAAANARSTIASTRSASSARHAAIVARPFIPDQDAVAVEEIQGSRAWRDAAYPSFDHFLASMRGLELVQ
jgi:hypothetical protein